MVTKNAETRRAFLYAAGSILSTWAVARFIPACSSEGLPARREPEAPARARPEPTDGDEFVPGAGASKNPTEPPAEANVGNAAWEQKAKALVAANQGGKAYTTTAPGPFPGKERSHVPTMTIQDDGVAIILVNHVMDPGGAAADAGASDAGDAGRDGGRDAGADGGGDAGSVDSGGARAMHYVATIWATDDKGRVVFLKELVATDPAPPFIAFKIPEGTTALTAYEFCNLHGVWAGDAMPTG
jgi:hypothetical protein